MTTIKRRQLKKQIIPKLFQPTIFTTVKQLSPAITNLCEKNNVRFNMGVKMCVHIALL